MVNLFYRKVNPFYAFMQIHSMHLHNQLHNTTQVYKHGCYHTAMALVPRPPPSSSFKNFCGGKFSLFCSIRTFFRLMVDGYIMDEHLEHSQCLVYY